MNFLNCIKLQTIFYMSIFSKITITILSLALLLSVQIQTDNEIKQGQVNDQGQVSTCTIRVNTVCFDDYSNLERNQVILTSPTCEVLNDDTFLVECLEGDNVLYFEGGEFLETVNLIN